MAAAVPAPIPDQQLPNAGAAPAAAADAPIASAALSPRPAAGKPATRTGYPYEPHGTAAKYLFAGGMLVIFGPAALRLFGVVVPASGGDLAATAGLLLVLALVLQSPALIFDAAPEEGGEPSTMRILSLAIVLVFCALTLKNGWDTDKLPDLAAQGNWVWLVTAALGGKAVQKFAEMKGQGK
jgi:hypothetical protein